LQIDFCFLGFLEELDLFLLRHNFCCHHDA
jgi:hypothetical protein